MTQRHSEPFYISPRLFDNRRLKRRRAKWMERLREHQLICNAEMRAQALASKTERGRRQRHNLATATLPADVTIDLLSDDDDENGNGNDVNAIVKPRPWPVPAGASSTCNSLFMHQPNLLLIPATTISMHHQDGSGGGRGHHTQRRPPKHGVMRQGNAATTTCVLGRGKSTATATATSMHSQSLTESILITSDDENNDNDIAKYVRRQHSMRSPPPLAPLTLSETVEEVTVSLVPRNTTTANCQARLRHSHPPHSGNYKGCNIPRAPPHTATTNGIGIGIGKGRASCSSSGNDGYLEVDVGSGITATLPDETTVHTVIANRIYELSLSKLREGLASSGVPEYTHDLLPEQLQKLSPALRAKVAPLVAPSPPTPISLKLSSDLSISLISDDDDCESSNPNHAAGGLGAELVYPVAAAEAHAAAKLLKQQQPQLSVVQHLQYAGGGFAPPVALALPVMAHTATTSTAPLPRRRKLG